MGEWNPIVKVEAQSVGIGDTLIGHEGKVEGVYVAKDGRANILVGNRWTTWERQERILVRRRKRAR